MLRKVNLQRESPTADKVRDFNAQDSGMSYDPVILPIHLSNEDPQSMTYSFRSQSISYNVLGT
ncbi:unnamed protein product [Larinioides sclopetarius]|uniref:Uncharacterized protein n=2 Tax=Larinioides sclopetarius TaxID=280406 RepID=A0AAV1ZDI3_9ARAC